MNLIEFQNVLNTKNIIIDKKSNIKPYINDRLTSEIIKINIDPADSCFVIPNEIKIFLSNVHSGLWVIEKNELKNPIILIKALNKRIQIRNFGGNHYPNENMLNLNTFKISNLEYLSLFTTVGHDLGTFNGSIYCDQKGIINYVINREPDKIYFVSDSILKFLELIEPEPDSEPIEWRYTKNGTAKMVDRDKWYQDENGKWKEIRFKK